MLQAAKDYCCLWYAVMRWGNNHFIVSALYKHGHSDNICNLEQSCYISYLFITIVHEINCSEWNTTLLSEPALTLGGVGSLPRALRLQIACTISNTHMLKCYSFYATINQRPVIGIPRLWIAFYSMSLIRTSTYIITIAKPHSNSRNNIFSILLFTWL